MDEFIAYLIAGAVVIAIIVYLLILVAGILLVVGLGTIVTISVTGTICGFSVGAINFTDVIRESHRVVPR